jgi:tight adherence protein B
MDATGLNIWLVMGLATLAAGGVLYVFVYPYLSGDIKAERRQAALASSGPRRLADRATDTVNRRKQIADSLKDIETRAKGKKHSLEARIGQAGLKWTRRGYIITSILSGLLFGLVLLVLNGNPYVCGAGTIVGGVGLPSWVLNYRRKRRLKKFVDAFPAAVDIIIRGIKAGLPVGDCLRVIASEADEPVRTEFRLIVEAQALGLGIGEAVERIVDRVPVAEASFFSIVINIQQKAGGNLSEALANLSNVLRERKKMQGKIKAMSSEAKASAMIIGALPFVVATFVYLTSPHYIELLWTTSTGRIVLGFCAFWMTCGVLTMKKMINFDM